MISLARISALILCLGSVGAVAQTVADVSLQPRAVDAAACVPSGDAQWLTPAEKSCYATTPDYDDTMAYLRRVQAAAPGQVKIEGFGKTGEGRELDIVIASRDGVFDPAAIHAAKRPIVLVQNSIHAGEMDGKDACLASAARHGDQQDEGCVAGPGGVCVYPDVQRRWA